MGNRRKSPTACPLKGWVSALTGGDSRACVCYSAFDRLLAGPGLQLGQERVLLCALIEIPTPRWTAEVVKRLGADGSTGPHDGDESRYPTPMKVRNGADKGEDCAVGLRACRLDPEDRQPDAFDDFDPATPWSSFASSTMNWSS